MNSIYKKQVGLLLRVIPIISEVEHFAVHGGTAINLFVKNMPRYSVDIDITYLPLEDRQTSLDKINRSLQEVEEKIKRAINGVRTLHKPDVCKLLCTYQGAQIKIEVNQTKRGIIGGDVVTIPLCNKAQEEFGLYCEARIVPLTLLYGGKVAAALSRQHPRDLFDCKYMEMDSFSGVKNGLMLYLLGSDKPIVESLNPNLTDQRQALDNQFVGMTDTPFTYEDFEKARLALIDNVRSIFNEQDRAFILSFEMGEPNWSICCSGDLSQHPSVMWKLQNIVRLKLTNHDKFIAGVEKLRKYFDSNRS